MKVTRNLLCSECAKPIKIKTKVKSYQNCKRFNIKVLCPTCRLEKESSNIKKILLSFIFAFIFSSSIDIFCDFFHKHIFSVDLIICILMCLISLSTIFVQLYMLFLKPKRIE